MNICKYLISRIYPLYEKVREKFRQPVIATDYVFSYRGRNAANLTLVLAGYQPFYWDLVFERLKVNQDQFEEEMDICICIPKGVAGARERIESYCAQYGWSSLFISDDLLAQAQNTAISLFPEAKWIYKIDEDIVLSERYFNNLKSAYFHAERDQFYDVGFIAPLINLNACCTPVFLQTIGLFDKCKDIFGPYKIVGKDFMMSNVHRNTSFAQFVWENTMPFDDVAQKIYERNQGKIEICSIRFSIGAILFTRDFWERIGKFVVVNVGVMGAEEAQVNNYCQEHMLGIYVAADTLVGHLGFGPQKEACKRFYEDNKESIHIK
jgi:hypothetical protein